MSMSPDPSREPSRSHRPLWSGLRAFLEERNIFWGELAGGLLVVGCSLALVISLWETFSANALFQLTTFTAAVAAVFGAGLYTYSRWKLASTSRGLLIVALLLVPINTLALALAQQAASVNDWLRLLSPLLSLLLVAYPIWRAARVLVPDGAGLLTLGILLISTCQVPIARHRATDYPVLMGLLPVLAYNLTGGLFLWSIGRKGDLERSRVQGMFAFLGLASFPLLLALGLLVGGSGDPLASLGLLAVPLALAALPLVAGGSLIHHGLTNAPRAGGQRTAGTIAALAGMVIMVLAVGLAWPKVEQVIAVCLLDYIVFSILAFRVGWLLAHLAALPCLSLAALLLVAGFEGQLAGPAEDLPARMLAWAMLPETGTALFGLFLLIGLVSEILDRVGAERHALAYAGGGLVLGLLGLCLATWTGPAEPMRTASSYAFVGVLALLLNHRWRLAQVTMFGLLLLIGGSLWCLWGGREWVPFPVWGTVLAGEGALLSLVDAWIHRKRESQDDAGSAVRHTAMLASCAAFPVAVLASWLEGFSSWPLAHVITAGLPALVWTGLAVREERPSLASLAGWLLLVTMVLFVGWVEQQTPERIPLVLASASGLLGVVLAGSAALLQRTAAGDSPSRIRMRLVLQDPWSQTALGAGVLALVLVGYAPRQPEQILPLACAAAIAFLRVGTTGLALYSWIGSGLVLLGLVQALTWGIAAGLVAHPVLVALLLHGTLVLSLAMALRMAEIPRDSVSRLAPSSLHRATEPISDNLVPADHSSAGSELRSSDRPARALGPVVGRAVVGNCCAEQLADPLCRLPGSAVSVGVAGPPCDLAGGVQSGRSAHLANLWHQPGLAEPVLERPAPGAPWFASADGSLARRLSHV